MSYDIKLKDLNERVSFKSEHADCGDHWPEMGININGIKWSRAEPDNGTVASIYDYRMEGWIDGVCFTTFYTFLRGLYVEVGDEIEESEALLGQVIQRYIDDYLEEQEQ